MVWRSTSHVPPFSQYPRCRQWVTGNIGTVCYKRPQLGSTAVNKSKFESKPGSPPCQFVMNFGFGPTWKMSHVWFLTCLSAVYLLQYSHLLHLHFRPVQPSMQSQWKWVAFAVQAPLKHGFGSQGLPAENSQHNIFVPRFACETPFHDDQTGTEESKTRKKDAHTHRRCHHANRLCTSRWSLLNSLCLHKSLHFCRAWNDTRSSLQETASFIWVPMTSKIQKRYLPVQTFGCKSDFIQEKSFLIGWKCKRSLNLRNKAHISLSLSVSLNNNNATYKNDEKEKNISHKRNSVCNVEETCTNISIRLLVKTNRRVNNKTTERSMNYWEKVFWFYPKDEPLKDQVNIKNGGELYWDHFRCRWSTACWFKSNLLKTRQNMHDDQTKTTDMHYGLILPTLEG